MRISDWSADVCSSDLAIHSCSHFDSNGHPRTSRFDGGSRDSVVRSGSAETAPIDQVADVAKDLHDGFINAGPLLMNMEDLYRLLPTGHVQPHGIDDTVTDPFLLLNESLWLHCAIRSFF